MTTLHVDSTTSSPSPSKPGIKISEKSADEISPQDVARFFAYVAPIMDDRGCWEWISSTVNSGYGSFAFNGGNGKRYNWLAHRLSYSLEIGPIPPGLTIDHLCKNRLCVNPAHLEPVTMRENLMRSDSVSAKRARQSHCLRGHELTEENVIRDSDRPRSRRCKACRIASRPARTPEIRAKHAAYERQRRARRNGAA